ncbi:hypothetical protein J6590_053974 [Homalodisca vitripennis]|nr:hypothetical protein J6590_053974 [Homalodisca vitripennis]
MVYLRGPSWDLSSFLSTVRNHRLIVADELYYQRIIMIDPPSICSPDWVIQRYGVESPTPLSTACHGTCRVLS